jgi:hypothetical protein
MNKDEIKKYLKTKVGILREDFKYFGGSFIHYEQFCEYQLQKIDDLSTEEAKAILYLIDSITYLRPRHTDFYNIGEQFIIDGIYFHENGKIMTFSRP